MTRGQGKHSPRTPGVVPDSGEGRDIGLSDRQLGTPSPIPGGDQHLLNHETMRQHVPTPVPRPEFRGVMAHGVPPAKHSAHERADAMRGPNTTHDPQPTPTAPAAHPVAPVPVYIVERGAHKQHRSASPRHFALQASTGEAVRLCGLNLTRTNIWLLNESTSSDIRFAHRITDLTNGGGALLPWPGNSYLKLETQDELFAISADSGTPTISVIEEFEQSW